MLELIPFDKEEKTYSLKSDILWKKDHMLINFIIQGDYSQVNIPSPRNKERKDGLWKNTCFEFFLSSDLKKNSTPLYLEANFSPNYNWDIFTFNNIRDGKTELLFNENLIRIKSEINDNLYKISIKINSKIFPTHLQLVNNKNLRASLTAVILNKDNKKDYFALKHLMEKPDFHHPLGLSPINTILKY